MFQSMIIVNILSIVNVLIMLSSLTWGDFLMISYDPFYKTLYKKGITEYQLIFKYGFSANTIQRMKKGMPITTKTLDSLCFVLNCEVEDVLFHDKTK